MTTVAILIGVILLGVLIFGFVQAREHFLKEWMPSVITGLVLIGLVPVANEVYWKRQKDTEICIQDREKRYELLGSVTQTYTHLFKIHTRLSGLQEEQQEEERALRKPVARGRLAKDALQVHLSRLSALTSERSELTKERARLEGQLAKDQALIARFYSDEVWKQYADLAGQYDNRTSKKPLFNPTQDDPVVQGAFALANKMAKEVREYEGKCS